MANIVEKATDTDVKITTDRQVPLKNVIRMRDDLSNRIKRLDETRVLWAKELADYNDIIAQGQAAGVKSEVVKVNPE